MRRRGEHCGSAEMQPTRLSTELASTVHGASHESRLANDTLTGAETGVATGLPEAAMCVQEIDVQCVLQFTLIHAAGCALHRHTSRVIHRLEMCDSYRQQQQQQQQPVVVCMHALRTDADRPRRTKRSSTDRDALALDVPTTVVVYNVPKKNGVGAIVRVPRNDSLNLAAAQRTRAERCRRRPATIRLPLSPIDGRRSIETGTPTHQPSIHSFDRPHIGFHTRVDCGRPCPSYSGSQIHTVARREARRSHVTR